MDSKGDESERHGQALRGQLVIKNLGDKLEEMDQTGFVQKVLWGPCVAS